MPVNVTGRRVRRHLSARAATDQLPLNVLYYGCEAPLPERHELRAGPWSATFEQGQLLNIAWHGQEVVRRIYVAVRDSDWGTVSAELSEIRPRCDAHGFQVEFSARHRQNAIDFAWRGRIEAFAAGRLTFAMQGSALSTFLRSRIGFCVLHAAKACAGNRFLVGRPDGTKLEGRFPEAISQDPVIAGTEAMQSLDYRFAPESEVRIQFEGDVFQMEDQRAWTDATFKSFCTPLHLAWPVQVHRGERVSQTVGLEVRTSQRPFAVKPSREAIPVSVAMGAHPVNLPRLGLGAASHEDPLNDAEIERLRSLHLAHLRVDLKLWEPQWPVALRRAALDATKLDCALEVAIELSDSAEEQLPQLRKALQRERPRIDRYLVFHRSEMATSGTWVLLARRILAEYDSAAQFGSGTNANYYELASFRLPSQGLDFLCCTVQPQTHAFDNGSLIETLEVQGEIVRSARRRYGNLPVSITPITLKPRFNPETIDPEVPPAAGELPAQVDVRQMSLFGACWTLGSLKHLCEAGAASLTYFETTGWRGVMEQQAGPPLPDRFRSLPGAVFPLYHVLADIGEFAGGNVLPSQSAEPLKVECLALARERCQRVLLANMTGETISVAAGGFATTSVLVKRLDETTAMAATVNPRAFRESDAERQRTTDGALRINLCPYSVVRVDVKV